MKYVLSAFLVFHVAAIFVLPNPDSILYREMEKVFVPYGNLLGMNTTWRFFSPNPLIQILEYRVLTKSSEEEQVYRYPESVAAAGSREGFNRRLNNAMFMMAHTEYLREFLGPYLCRRHPGAEGLAFYGLSRNFPTVEQARLYQVKRDGIERMNKRHLLDISCEAEP